MSEPVRFPRPDLPPVPALRVVRKGYDRQQVDALLADLRERLADASWAGDELATGRAQLAADRAAFDEHVRGWKPSFTTLSAHLDGIARQLEAEADAAAARTRRAEQQAMARIAEKEHLDELQLADRRRTAELQATGILASARAQAEELRAAAQAEAQRIVSAAHDEVARLQRLQAALTVDLNRTHDRLSSVVSDLDPPVRVPRTA